MSEVNGRRTVCDRCGAEIFSPHIGDEERDGGFTRWNKFEPKPKGWTKKDNKDLCPDCSGEWNKIETAFMNEKLRFFRGGDKT